MQTSIQNIIFDLGHVIIDIDFQKTIDAFRNLGLLNFHVALDNENPIFNQYETGKISTSIFLSHWQKKLPGIDSQAIIQAWNALLVEIKPEVFDILIYLKDKYKLFIYSNTNELHINWVKAYLKSEYNMIDWEPAIFEKAYYSHELGLRKPDKNGYLAIMENHQLEPGKTLFIDDHLPNIQAALKIGLRCINKSPAQALSAILLENKLLN